MGIRRGEVNVGQLMREHVGDKHPDLVANLGFTTHTGTVAAADDWNEPVKNKRVNPSLPGVLSDMQLTLPHDTTDGSRFCYTFKASASYALFTLLEGPCAWSSGC